MAATAIVEEWDDERKLDEALQDVKDGMFVSTPMDITASPLRYGIVVGENPELSSKIAGFPEFGDTVLFYASAGRDCASFARMSRGSGRASEYRLTDQTQQRKLTVKRGDKLVILQDALEDIVWMEWTWAEFLNGKMAREFLDKANKVEG